MLAAAGLVQGTAFGFYGPARVAFTTELVGREQLGNAITLSLLSMNGTRVVAPSLAGALAGIAFFGIGGAYLVAGAFSFVSFLAVLRLPRVAPAADLPPARPLAEIIDGVRYVRSRPHLRRLLVSSFVVIMFGFNYVVFIPALVKDTFDLDNDGWVGLISSAASIGAVAVGLWLAGRADQPGRWRVMAITGTIFGTGVVALALIADLLGCSARCHHHRWRHDRVPIAVKCHLTEPDRTVASGPRAVVAAAELRGFGIAALPLGLLAEAVGRRQAMALMGAIATAAILIYAAAERSAQAEIEAGDPEPAQGSTQTPPPDVDGRSPATVLKPSTRPAQR